MKTTKAIAGFILASNLLSSIASATIIMDWVAVGHAGNTADTTGYGAVAYTYQIGKYEVTNAQYGAFLNAAAKTDNYGLYNGHMAGYGITRSGNSGGFTYSVTSGFENKPVVWVSWFDAARFSNWMHNGQGSSGTENGAYTILGANSGIITVNTGAKVWIPTEDEWYKAAYYKGATSTYSLYPNGQNSITTADANYDWSIGSATDVGSYSHAPSSYGTYDQGGNAAEWTDGVFGSSRGNRGGPWFGNHQNLLTSEPILSSGDPTNSYFALGFRVASVPEPSSMLLTMLASGVMLIRRKR